MYRRLPQFEGMRHFGQCFRKSWMDWRGRSLDQTEEAGGQIAHLAAQSHGHLEEKKIGVMVF